MRDKTRLSEEIRRLAAERRAVILVHNYERGEVQEIGDFQGDSLELARKAADTDAEVILFCGVHFMAETAAILSPDKTVIAARVDAGCPMADMVNVDKLKKVKDQHPGAVVVCYVNTTAAVKAESYITCTSANAAEVVSSFPEEQEIIFVPDSNLAANVERITGRNLIRWPGYCPIHADMTTADVQRARAQFPQAEIWAHPECPVEVASAADFALSTGKMVERAKETKAGTVVVATELGMIFRLRQERPDIAFVPLTEQAVCVDMKLTTLEDARDALDEMKNIITVSEEVRGRAALAVERMLAIG